MDASPVSASRAAERSLELSRRLDWRFLLPDPALDTVACIGSGDAELLDALRRFARSVTILDAAAIDGANDHAFDVLVARDISAVSPAYHRLVKRHGFLYAEFERRTLRRRVAGLSGVAALTASASSSGFTDTRLHWHWPSFATCTRILPLDDHTALTFAAGRGGPPLRTAIAEAAAAVAIRGGVIARTARSISLIARAA